jgi:hypothetical protein
MYLSLKVLNSDATLNSFADIEVQKFTSGSSVTLILRLWQPDKDIRYIPAVGAVISVNFKKSDNTDLAKTASTPFADDKSIIKFELTAAESVDIISQSLSVEVNESGTISHAYKQSVIQKVTTDNTGC